MQATDARLAREQQAQLVPRLRAAGRGLRLRRLVPGAAIGCWPACPCRPLPGHLHPALVPVAWRGYVPRWEVASSTPGAAAGYAGPARPRCPGGGPSNGGAPANRACRSRHRMEPGYRSGGPGSGQLRFGSCSN